MRFDAGPGLSAPASVAAAATVSTNPLRRDAALTQPARTKAAVRGSPPTDACVGPTPNPPHLSSSTSAFPGPADVACPNGSGGARDGHCDDSPSLPMAVKLDPGASGTVAAFLQQPTDPSESRVLLPPLEPPDYLYAGRAATTTLPPDWWAPCLPAADLPAGGMAASGEEGGRLQPGPAGRACPRRACP